jgi:hypothetical protein
MKEAYLIYDKATVALSITGFNNLSWCRKTKDKRYGPWTKELVYTANEKVWDMKTCLYMLSGSDNKIRLVGITTGKDDKEGRLKDRWRLSPPYSERDHNGEQKKLSAKSQLFHSSCTPYIEKEFDLNKNANFELRAIEADDLAILVAGMGFPVHASTNQELIDKLETWMCRNKTHDFVNWNKAKTR